MPGARGWRVTALGLRRSLRAAWRRWLARHAPRTFARTCRLTPHELGEVGEELAARELAAAGFEILGRRVRTRHAEVDLLARQGDELVCVEVKTTLTTPTPRARGAPPPPPAAPFRREGRLGLPQRDRLARAARELARARGLRARVDRVDVTIESHTGRLRLMRHVGIASRGESPSGSRHALRGGED